MANTYVDYTATAAQTDFAFSFPYLEDSHVVVEIDGVVKTLTTHYTIVTTPSKKIVLGSGATVGQVVRVRRDSDADSSDPFVDFVNGSVLTEDALDKSYLHNLYLNEEIGELNVSSLQKAVGGTQWDAKSLRIINVADPTGVQDASTKNYIDTQITNTVTGSSTISPKTTFTGNASDTIFIFGSGITLDGDTMYEVAINGVLQEPTVAYTIDADSNAITFANPPPSSAKIVVVQRGYAVPVTTGAVSGSQLATSSVDSTKLATDAVTADKIIAGAVGSSELAATTVSAGAYTNADITVDADGRLTAAASGDPGLTANSVTSSQISDTDTQFLVDDTSVQKKVVINEAGADVDFRVEGDTDANLIVTDGANDVAGIGATDASYKLNVAGNLKIVGPTTLEYSSEPSSGLYSGGTFLKIKNSSASGETSTCKWETLLSASYSKLFHADLQSAHNRMFLGFADGDEVGLRITNTNAGDGTGSTFASVHDNKTSCGTASARWSVVYAGTGSINTSDRNAKEDIEDLSEAELRVATAIKGLIKKFKFKGRVRKHVGVIAQDVQDAFTDEGLDASEYGLFCSDTWTDEETGEEETRLGIRYEELLAFVIAAL